MAMFEIVSLLLMDTDNHQLSQVKSMINDYYKLFINEY
jgi:hypothetical protein